MRVRVQVPEDSGFGLENLPYGVFAPPGGRFRVGVRIGDHVLDLATTLGDPILAHDSLNPLLAAGPGRWREVQERTQMLLDGEVVHTALHPISHVRLAMPIQIGDYVDFNASIDHATNLGKLLRRDDEPLLPNWRYLPVGYHGRAGTVVVSGTNIERPRGQHRGTGTDSPVFEPTQQLDIEPELGFVVGMGSWPGTPLRTDEFAEHVFGTVLLNDWSARDIQAWEYRPLGPFLGTSFATSISAWVTPLDALHAARIPLPVQYPEPLPYLREHQDWGLDIDLCVWCNGQAVSYPSYSGMYWSPAQMLAHMTGGGANVRPGDLYASGAISGPEPQQRGSLIELTWGGTEPITVLGTERTFLTDGDAVTITGTAAGPWGRRIGLGEVGGMVVPPAPIRYGAHGYRS